MLRDAPAFRPGYFDQSYTLLAVPYISKRRHFKEVSRPRPVAIPALGSEMRPKLIMMFGQIQYRAGIDIRFVIGVQIEGVHQPAQNP